MKKDIQTREDIMVLMDQFYKKIKVSPVLRPVFIDIAQVDFEAHMPVLYDFWSTLLLGDMSYTRNAMEPHLRLNRKAKLTKAHFAEWLNLFNETMEECFEGEKATEAKHRAHSISGLMLFKMESTPGY